MPSKLLSASRRRASADPEYDKNPAAEDDEDPTKKDDPTAEDGENPDDIEKDPATEDAPEDGEDDSFDDEDEPDGDENKPAAHLSPARKAVLTERARIASILTCKGAQGRAAAALHLATATDLSSKAARALLTTMPKGPSTGALAQAMAAHPGPKVGLDGPAVTATAQSDPAGRILASYARVTGKPVRHG